MTKMIHKRSGKIRDIKPDNIDAKLARGWELYENGSPTPKQVIVDEPINVKVVHDDMLTSEQVEPTEE